MTLTSDRRVGRPVLAAAGVPVAVLSAWFTGHLVHRVVTGNKLGDFDAHLAFTANWLERGDPVPGNVLLYWLTALFAGFDPDRLLTGLVIVLGVAGAAKAWLTVSFVGDRRWGALAAGLCLLAFSLPVGDPYLGQIPPSVWHNSTTMLLMPFAIGLWWTSLTYLRTRSRRTLWAVLALAALNVAAKPSFVLCFLVVFPLAAWCAHRTRRDMLPAWLATGATAALVGVQYAYIYVSQRGGAATDEDSVVVDPLRVWSAFSDDIPVSLLCSYLFPVAALLLGGPAIRRDLAVRYAAALAVVGAAIFALVKETGPRELDGNFVWQAIVTNYLLFLAVVAAAVPWLRTRRTGWRQVVVVVAFLAHVVAGVLYLHDYLTTGRYR